MNILKSHNQQETQPLDTKGTVTKDQVKDASASSPENGNFRILQKYIAQ
jgi:hypothetical protein